MTQTEDKELLLKDLCARLPYGVKVSIQDITGKYRTIAERLFDTYAIQFINNNNILIKPYLRPMSNMTEEERDELRKLCRKEEGILYDIGISGAINAPIIIDYLNSHYLDFRGLIPMDLALEAPEGMYK